MFSPEQIQTTKEEILTLLNKSPRITSSNLINYLTTETDFFTAPASSKFHNNTSGGLADHSLKVYKLLNEKCKQFNAERLDEEGIIITGLLHDLCKVNLYYQETKYKKNSNNEWIKYNCWGIKDELPMLHGSKSVYLIQQHIKLKPVEAIMIEQHMGGRDLKDGNDFFRICDKLPEVILMHHSDFESSMWLERRSEE
ncbi:MAG: HD domain-containing protein [bacterium]